MAAIPSEKQPKPKDTEAKQQAKPEFKLQPAKPRDPDLKHIIRIKGVDISGDKKIQNALRDIKGVGKTYAKAIMRVAGIPDKQVGYYSEADVAKIEAVFADPKKFGIPVWMLNRRKDFETGENRHVIEADLAFATRSDIEFMKKIRCRTGIRHAFGLKVRGQRTKSTGRAGKSVGVAKRTLMGGPKKEAAPAAKKEAPKGK